MVEGTNPFEKYARQNGFIFPNFRGKNSKNIWAATTLGGVFRGGLLPYKVGFIDFRPICLEDLALICDRLMRMEKSEPKIFSQMVMKSPQKTNPSLGIRTMLSS